jgi:hypothetical protein
LKDTFRVSIATPDKFSVIITEHSSEDFEAHALVRETANGEVHPAKLTIKKDSIVGIKPKPDPKAWKALAEKPARTIIDKAGLLDFFMIIDSRMIQ